MKYLSIIIIVLLSGCSSPNKPIDKGVESQLKELMQRKTDCQYQFKVMSITAFTEQPPEGRVVKDEVVFLGDNDLMLFCSTNTKEVYPILVKMMKESNYEWISNLLLYNIMAAPADNLRKFVPDKCSEWKKEQKQKDIEFWKNYKPKFIDNH
jgi:hypothetical protein